MPLLTEKSTQVVNKQCTCDRASQGPTSPTRSLGTWRDTCSRRSSAPLARPRPPASESRIHHIVKQQRRWELCRKPLGSSNLPRPEGDRARAWFRSLRNARLLRASSLRGPDRGPGPRRRGVLGEPTFQLMPTHAKRGSGGIFQVQGNRRHSDFRSDEFHQPGDWG